MANRGFTIKDQLTRIGIKLNIPKGVNNFQLKKSNRDSICIYVECVIERIKLKTFIKVPFQLL